MCSCRSIDDGSIRTQLLASIIGEQLVVRFCCVLFLYKYVTSWRGLLHRTPADTNAPPCVITNDRLRFVKSLNLALIHP
jgi:hypothetical protein